MAAMRVQSPIRTLEVETDSGVQVYKHALSWAAFGRLQDAWKMDLAEVEKKISSPTYQTVNDILLATACKGGAVESMADVEVLADQITPAQLMAFVQEVVEAAQPPESPGQRPTPAAPKKPGRR